MNNLRTRIEVDKKAFQNNLAQILKLIPEKTRFMAVIKSNAYGHGLTLAAKLFAEYRIQNSKLWFGVDSIVEALRLRREGIRNPILVLGYTLPSRIPEAASKDITLTVSSFESLKALLQTKNKPVFHLKIDTGMHRQGFQPEEIQKLVGFLKKKNLAPQGIYTHFAAAKDIAYPTITLRQLAQFKKAAAQFKRAGFGNLILHAAASGGTLLFPESRLDMVRIGIALYGYWPSLEAKTHLKDKIKLQPILSWKTIVGEVKTIPAGSCVGYDLTEKVSRKTKIAILPVGYWHGYDRGLSSIGEILVRGKRAKVLGRVSMDMTVVDITNIPKVKIGDEVVLIGKQGRNAIWADELALKIGTSHYEFLTRINPLICRLT